MASPARQGWVLQEVAGEACAGRAATSAGARGPFHVHCRHWRSSGPCGRRTESPIFLLAAGQELLSDLDVVLGPFLVALRPAASSSPSTPAGRTLCSRRACVPRPPEPLPNEGPRGCNVITGSGLCQVSRPVGSVGLRPPVPSLTGRWGQLAALQPESFQTFSGRTAPESREPVRRRCSSGVRGYPPTVPRLPATSLSSASRAHTCVSPSPRALSDPTPDPGPTSAPCPPGLSLMRPWSEYGSAHQLPCSGGCVCVRVCECV